MTCTVISTGEEYEKALTDNCKDWIDYCISCSRSSKISESKNCLREISKPSQIFLIDTTPGFWLFSLSILYIVDGDTPDILANPWLSA